MPSKKVKPFKCACGCGIIKSIATERRHMAGCGPMLIMVAHEIQKRKEESHRSRHQQPRPRSHGLPRNRRSKPLPSPGITPSVSTHSIFGPNSPGHHTSAFEVPQSGDPGPSTTRHRKGEADSVNRATADSVHDLGQPAQQERQRSTHRVHLEEVSDEEDDWGMFVAPGYISDNSDWESDGSEMDMEDEDWLTRVTEEDTLRDAFQAEVASLARNLNDDELDDIEAFNYKISTNLTDSAYSKLPRGFRRLSNLTPIDKLQRRIAFLSGVRPRLYDCCVNSCCCYTREYEKKSTCPFCREPRYDATGKARNRFSYLPLLPRFKAWFRNPGIVSKLLYRANYKSPSDSTSNSDNDMYDIMDIFDGTHYIGLLDEHVTIGGNSLPHTFFSDDDDIALGLSFDGFCPFKRRKQTCWPIVAFNYNLPPEERFHIDNIICVGVIPGPKQAKDTDSFIWPLVEEMLKLAEGQVVFNARTGKSICLHAYIIAAFGDIPAVAKLMRMKGHNGKCPCRMCSMTAIPHTVGRGTTHYTPLWRPNNSSYDSLHLPLRNHAEFLAQASQVDHAPNDNAADALSKKFGIKGTPVLSLLPSLNFPTSFPYDFMHLVWENVVKTLADLWGGKDFKGFDDGSEQYQLKKPAWIAIGEACKRAGDTIPSAFGCRVPNIATERSHFIAESWAQWTLFVGPILLRKAWRKPEYHEHFVNLVSLLKMCMQFGMNFEDVTMLKTGLAEWVTEYERIYLQENLSRLPVCTLPIHGLLHLADSIRAMGPVWCYWAFPMERFCGSLLPAIRSRRFPYASINRRVVELAQLNQIKAIYNLHETLDLRNRCNVEKSGHALKEYPDSVFVYPKKVEPLSRHYRQRIVNHLAVRFDVEKTVAKRFLPNKVECWGKLHWLHGGDMQHAADLVPNRGGRDMTWVKYTLLEDLNFHKRNLRAAGVSHRADYYGQLLRLVVFTVPADVQLKTTVPTTIALALVRSMELNGRNRWGTPVANVGKFRAVEAVDIQSLDTCAVGRILERQKVFFIEQLGSKAALEFSDDLEDASKPTNPRQK